MRQFTHNYYNRDESSSYSRTGKRFFIQYPQGVNVSGPIVKETISVSNRVYSRGSPHNNYVILSSFIGRLVAWR